MEYPSKRRRVRSPPLNPNANANANANGRTDHGTFIERPMSEMDHSSRDERLPLLKEQEKANVKLPKLHPTHQHRHPHSSLHHMRPKQSRTPSVNVQTASLRPPMAVSSCGTSTISKDASSQYPPTVELTFSRSSLSRTTAIQRRARIGQTSDGTPSVIVTAPQHHHRKPNADGNRVHPNAEQTGRQHAHSAAGVGSSPTAAQNAPFRHPSAQVAPALSTKRPSAAPSAAGLPLIPLIISAAGIEVSAQTLPALATHLPPPITTLPPLPPAIQVPPNPTIPVTLTTTGTSSTTTATTTTDTSTSLSSTSTLISTTTSTSLLSSTFTTTASTSVVTTVSPSGTSITALAGSSVSSQTSLIPTTLVTSTRSRATTSSLEPTSTTTPSSSSAIPTASLGSDMSNAQNSDTGNGTNVPTPTLVGSVVGGVAGLSIILLLLLLILRWYKRRKFGPARGISSGEPSAPSTSAGDTAELVGAAGGAGSGAGLLKRMSRPKSIPPPAATERGFERISGRKLPSQFSPGMEGPSKEIGAAGLAYPSGSSAYPSGGTFESEKLDPVSPTSPLESGEASLGSSPPKDTIGPLEKETMMPGPARTPVLQQGEPVSRSSLLATTSRTTPSPTQGLQPGSLGRSHPSFDGSRGSKFTEDV